jgi:hypothetical protein
MKLEHICVGLRSERNFEVVEFVVELWELLKVLGSLGCYVMVDPLVNCDQAFLLGDRLRLKGVRLLTDGLRLAQGYKVSLR